MATLSEGQLCCRQPKLLDVHEQVRGIGIDAKCASAFQLFLPLTSRQKPYAEGAVPNGSERLPHAVADPDAVVNCDVETISRGRGDILRRLGLLYVFSGHNRSASRKCQPLQSQRSLFSTTRARNFDLNRMPRRQRCSQLLIRSRQLLSMRNHGAKAAVVFALELVEINFAFPACYFPKQFLHHRFSIHSHRAANLLFRNHNAGGAQSFGPGVYVLVIAVNQSAVEVKPDGGHFQMLCFRKRLGWKTFLAASRSGHAFRWSCGTASSVELHISRERLRVKRRTIANNSNRRITILIKTLSLSLSPSLHLHANLIVCGYLIVCG
jgi:hypothetical protein